MKSSKITERVAETVLGTPILIGKKEYAIARPTIRTLIAVSREIAKLPKFVNDEKNTASSIIAYAKYSENIGRVFATMILGGRKHTSIKDYFSYEKKVKKLANKILDEHTPMELTTALTLLISQMEIKDFFVLTTSLNEINLVKPTVEVD